MTDLPAVSTVTEATKRDADDLGQLVALAYLIFVGLLFSHIVEGAFVRRLEAITVFQIGFAFAIISIALVRFTSLDMTAVFIAVAGLAYNDAGVRMSKFDGPEDMWAMIIGTHAVFMFVPLMIFHLQDGIFVRKPII